MRHKKILRLNRPQGLIFSPRTEYPRPKYLSALARGSEQLSARRRLADGFTARQFDEPTFSECLHERI